MPLNAPKLDDRTFQDIVDEAKKRIPLYAPGWTDLNISDPGIALIELFAWMTEMMLYRMNQVPELHYVKFMELMGITLREPVPAHVPLTFWSYEPIASAVTIPSGTEVTSAEVEGELPIIFSTTEELVLQPPQLTALFSAKAANKNKQESQTFVTHSLSDLKTGSDAVEIFTAVPQPNDAIYFGFTNNLTHHTLSFTMDFEAVGLGVDPTRPPYVWEAWHEAGWQACNVENDTTWAMSTAGQIQVHVPQLTQHALNNQTLYWVRVRIPETLPKDGRAYRHSPSLKQLTVATLGGTTSASHARYIRNELLGQSDGMAGQQFQLQHIPVIPRQGELETLLVQTEGEKSEVWTEVPNFSDSGPNDKHFTLDGVTGELRLGPALRQLDGSMRLYGEIPPRGATLIFQQYRAGGNQEGNVQAGVLNTLRKSLTGIERVINRQAAVDGTAAETLEAAKMRVPRLLRTRHRAVTAEDFEYLAQEAQPRVGRAKCLPIVTEAGTPTGQVNLLIVPNLPLPERANPTPTQLTLADTDLAQIKEYVGARSLLTTRLTVGTPEYCWASVQVAVQLVAGQDFQRVELAILQRLFRFLNPLSGGFSGTGWPFGRDLVAADVYQCLAHLPGVAYLRQIRLFASDGVELTDAEPVAFISVPEHGLIVSGQHRVSQFEA